MLVYFCRHGQTDANAAGIIQGHVDTRLNAQGRAEAARLARRLARERIGEAWSSELSRALERGLGSLEGRRRARGEPVPPDAEGAREFEARITGWLASFLAAHVPSPSPSSAPGPGPVVEPEPIVLVLSHGAYLSALLRVLLSPPVSLRAAAGLNLKQHCFNTSIMCVRFEYVGPLAPGVRAGRARAWGDGCWRSKKESAGAPKAEAKAWHGWTGVVETWADVAHLAGLDDPDAARDVADDLGR
ncbi:hypothetical protein Q5752_002658 [Cryptotrichosporon argae]